MVTKLFEGDMRLENLLQALKAMIYERGDGMTVPSILGVIEILKTEIIKEQTNAR